MRSCITTFSLVSPLKFRLFFFLILFGVNILFLLTWWSDQWNTTTPFRWNTHRMKSCSKFFWPNTGKRFDSIRFDLKKRISRNDTEHTTRNWSYMICYPSIYVSTFRYLATKHARMHTYIRKRVHFYQNINCLQHWYCVLVRYIHTQTLLLLYVGFLTNDESFQQKQQQKRHFPKPNAFIVRYVRSCSKINWNFRRYF